MCSPEQMHKWLITSWTKMKVKPLFVFFFISWLFVTFTLHWIGIVGWIQRHFIFIFILKRFIAVNPARNICIKKTTRVDGLSHSEQSWGIPGARTHYIKCIFSWACKYVSYSIPLRKLWGDAVILSCWCVSGRILHMHGDVWHRLGGKVMSILNETSC